VSSAASAAAIAGSQVTIAQGAVARARAAREQVEQLRDQTTVVAPIDGVVSSPKVSEGQMAGRGQPIVRISNPTSIRVRFAVAREQLDTITRGTRVDVIRVKGNPAPLTATVREVGSTLAPPLQFAWSRPSSMSRGCRPIRRRCSARSSTSGCTSMARPARRRRRGCPDRR
nr:HlyD family secretion protein [Deltaproteobacteria bacterium]